MIPDKDIKSFTTALEEVKEKMKHITPHHDLLTPHSSNFPSMSKTGGGGSIPDNEKQTVLWAEEIFHMSSIAGLDMSLHDIGEKEGLSAMQMELDLALREKKSMELFIKQLEDIGNNDDGCEDDDSDAEAVQRMSMQLEEKAEMLSNTLKDLQERCVDIATLKKELKANRWQLSQIETSYWSKLYKIETGQSRLVGENESVISKLTSTYNELTRLKRCYCFNDSFHIWYDGPFGTINGLRLGRLTPIPVTWNEMNAAFGQVALLLSSLSNLLGISVPNLEILPNGQHSKIKKTEGADGGKMHTLFYDGSWNALTKLNAALVCLYAYVSEMLSLPLLDDLDLVPPYKIVMSTETIGGISIGCGFVHPPPPTHTPLTL